MTITTTRTTQEIDARKDQRIAELERAYRWMDLTVKDQERIIAEQAARIAELERALEDCEEVS